MFSTKINAVQGFLFCEECQNRIDQNDTCLANHFKVYNNNLHGISNDLLDILNKIYNFFIFHKEFTEQFNKNFKIIQEPEQ